MEFLLGLLFFLIVGLIPLALTVGGIALIAGAVAKLLRK